MASKHYRATFLVLSFALFTVHGYAQSPPTATEAFNLRIKCKKMSDEKEQEIIENNTMLKWEYVMASNTSKYDPISNRCYGLFHEHITKQYYHLDHEYDNLYDLQIDEMLATATIENGKKNGSIFDPDYKKPWLPTCRADGCPANFGDQTWQAAEDYMSEFMADQRKQ
jgi:hypothetical protein